jgi:hypothetical protein
LWLEGASAGIEAVNPETDETLWKLDDGVPTIPSSVVTANSLLIPSNGLPA